MRRYLELLEDTGCALRLFYKYYRWEKVKESYRETDNERN